MPQSRDFPGEPSGAVLIMGDPVDGFRIVGPFENTEAALAHGARDRGQWWLAPLETPHGARLPFVVFLEDPDGLGDDSPWNAAGADLAEAVEDARGQWREWAEASPTARPEVTRAYPGAIGLRLDLDPALNANSNLGDD